MLALLYFVTLALAGDWTFSSSPIPVKNTLGPHSVGGDQLVVKLGQCSTTFDAANNCVAADGGRSSKTDATLVSSWSYIECFTIYDSSTHLVNVFARFYSGKDANGFATWPSTWPTSYTCTRTPSSGPEAGKHHVFSSSITNDTDNDWRYKAGTFTTSSITLGGGVSVTAESAFITKQWERNIPNGTYTGPTADAIDFMWSAASGGAKVDHTYCMVSNTEDEYLWFAVGDAVGVGTHTYYCRVIKDGTPTSVPITVTVQ